MGDKNLSLLIDNIKNLKDRMGYLKSIESLKSKAHYLRHSSEKLTLSETEYLDNKIISDCPNKCYSKYQNKKVNIGRLKKKRNEMINGWEEATGKEFISTEDSVDSDDESS